MNKLSIKTKENPRLLAKELKDGRKSLYLDYYLGRRQWTDEDGKIKVKHDRRKEFLGLYITDKPKTSGERQNNIDTMDLAMKIRFEKEQKLKESREGYRLKSHCKIDMFGFMQSYYGSYTKKDKPMIKGAVNRFYEFINFNYPVYASILMPEQISRDMVVKFVDYLQSTSRGEGALSYFRRFKKMIKAACDEDIIRKNPCDGVICRADTNTLTKDILSLREIEKLIATRYEGQNINVRRAFIFCLYTGIRYCDVKSLTYGNVDFSNKLLRFNQDKTKGHSSASWVTIPLNDGLLSLIGKGNKNDNIFKIPAPTTCSNELKVWIEKAGIDKHITWHCARHSFAVNILNNGANIKTVASLLGHSGLTHTEKYTRAVDELKQAAIDSLPSLGDF